MATTVTTSAQELVAKCTAMASDLLRLSAQHVWVDYDAEADVLYMSFRRPQRATRTVELDEDTLVRKDGQTVCCTLQGTSRHVRFLKGLFEEIATETGGDPLRERGGV